MSDEETGFAETSDTVDSNPNVLQGLVNLFDLQQQLKVARERQGKTIHETAELAGIPLLFFGRYDRGAVACTSLTHLFAWAGVLGVRPQMCLTDFVAGLQKLIDEGHGGTVWCSYPNIKRCGPFTESCLYDEVGYRVKIELEDMAEPSQQLEEILKERADAADRACQAFYGPIGPVGFKSDTGFAPKDSPPMHELGCCWDTDNGFAPSTT